MKFTNIKKLLIKFMGGGLINFPTRFLRWIKIDGDAEGDDDGGDGSGDSGSLLMSLIPSDYPKPDLFLFRRSELDNPIDVSNYKIDDFISLANENDDYIQIICLYKNSNLSAPIIGYIGFYNDGFGFSVTDVRQYIRYTEIIYNNENYYAYYEQSPT